MTDGPVDDEPQVGGSDTDTDNGNVIQLKEHRGGDTTGGKLTGKQMAFADNVIKGMDQTAAYRAAGYSTENMADKTVWEAASRLFANSKVSARINASRRRLEAAAVHTAMSLRHLIENELLAMIKEPETEGGKLRALELLGRSSRASFFTDRVADVSKELTAEEVETELKAKLVKAFGGDAS